MDARGLIEDGMSETDINAISSSDKLGMDKANKLEDTSSSKGEKSSLVTLYSNPLHCRNHEMFIPKEVACLTKKFGSINAGSLMSFGTNIEEQTMFHNITESSDGPSILDFLEKPTDGMFLFNIQKAQDRAS